MELRRRKVERVRGRPGALSGEGASYPAWPAWVALLICGFFLVAPSPVTAQNEDDNEYRLKLAFIYNFAQFTQWPPEAFRNPAAPLMVCVVGQNPFHGEIEQSLRGRTVGDHPLEIKGLKSDDTFKGCQMLFVRASERRMEPTILAALRGSSTLTVGEAKGFAESGGVINFVLEENRLRFEVNLDAATRSRVKISSKVLALARIVSSEPAP